MVTSTFVFKATIVLAGAVLAALVRRFARQAAYLVTVAVLNRPEAAYTYETPNRDLTDLPLTALILNQVLPETAFPAQVVRQLPPVTVAATDTLVPVLIILRTRAVVEVVVRRFALQRATFVAVAPRTMPGDDTATTAKTSMADTIDVTISDGKDERWGRRVGDKTDTSLGRTPRMAHPSTPEQ
ncbi:MAG: hypothetical protein ABJC39_10035 [Chloroflexota bacterium]